MAACAYFFTNAVSTKPNDSTISKLVKGLLKLPIYIIAAIILIPCIILNLVVSSIPLLIVLAINKSIANDKRNSVPIKAESGSEYSNLLEEEVEKISHSEHSLPTEEYEGNAASTNSDRPSQAVRVISRDTGSEEDIDQTTVVSGINNQNMKDGKAMVRVTGNDSNFTMKGIITGDIRGHSEATASAFIFECQIVPNGLDFQLGYKMRTRDTQAEATEELMQDESVLTMLSGNGGILAIEQPHATNVAIEEL